MKTELETSLENIQFRYRLVKCKICNGTGIDKTQSNMGIRCEKCDGTGSRMFPDGPVESCTSCQGRGKNYRFSIMGKACDECDGFGEVKLI